jgi:hypothetical protein
MAAVGLFAQSGSTFFDGKRAEGFSWAQLVPLALAPGCGAAITEYRP